MKIEFEIQLEDFCTIYRTSCLAKSLNKLIKLTKLRPCFQNLKYEIFQLLTAPF